MYASCKVLVKNGDEINRTNLQEIHIFNDALKS